MDRRAWWLQSTRLQRVRHDWMTNASVSHDFSEIVSLMIPWAMGFPGGSDNKDSSWNVGDLGSIPESECSPKDGNGLFLPGESPGQRSLLGYSSWGLKELDMTEWLTHTPLLEQCCLIQYPRPSLEKELATHSSILPWRIPGTGEPGGLPSMGLHRVRHDWSDLAAAAATDHLLQQQLQMIPHGMEYKYGLLP